MGAYGAGFGIYKGGTSGGGVAETLAQTLAAGNVTGANDISVDNGQVIKATNGGGTLDLRNGGDDNVALTTDSGGFNEGWFFADTGVAEMGYGSNNFFEANSSSVFMQSSGSIGVSYLSMGVSKMAYQATASIPSDQSDLLIFWTNVARTTKALHNTVISTSIKTANTTFNLGVSAVAIMTTGVTVKTDNAVYMETIALAKSSDTFELLLDRTALTADRTQNFQDASGTIALTSDIVTETLTQTLTAGNSTSGVNIVVTDGDKVDFGGNADITFNDTIEDFLFANVENIDGFFAGSIGVSLKGLKVDSGGGVVITNNPAQPSLTFDDQSSGTIVITQPVVTASRNISLPDASGTFALTSDLSAYLPLSGGTMTGTITSGSFKALEVQSDGWIALNGAADTAGLWYKSLGSEIEIYNSVASGVINLNAADGSVKINVDNLRLYNFTDSRLSIAQDADIQFSTIGGFTGTLVGATTGNRTWTLPDLTGTVALTSDINDSIYTGNGTVPSSVVATLTDTLTFANGGGGVFFQEGTGSGLTASGDADTVVITASSTNAGMSILAPAGGNSNFYFGEFGNSSKAAAIQFIGSVNEMRFNASNVNNLYVSSTRVRIDNNLTIGVNVPATSATNAITMLNGTAPTANSADTFVMYANDVVAGNSAPHFRTEAGDVVKLFSDSGWTAITGTSTKGGWSTTTGNISDVKQTVKAIYDALIANGLIKV
jgi:hypothetical protein